MLGLPLALEGDCFFGSPHIRTIKGNRSNLVVQCKVPVQAIPIAGVQT